MYEIIIRNIFQTSLIGSIGILLCIVLRKFICNKYTKNFTYYMWLIIIFKMLTPFKIPIYISEELYLGIFKSPNNIMINYNIGSYDIYKQTHFFQILFYLWLTGTIIFFSYGIYNYISFTRKINSLSSNILDNDIKKLYSKLLYKLNIKQNISLEYCEGIGTPLGVGIFKPMILLPKKDYSLEELEWILKHELIHFKRYDLYYKIITMITVTIHWFNPSVYIMLKLINYDCELSCDEALLKNSNLKLRKSYAITFINSLRLNKESKYKNNIILGFNNEQEILKRRIDNMFNIKMRKKGIGIGSLIMVITLMLFFDVKTFAHINKTASNPSISTSQANEERVNYIKKSSEKDKTFKYKGLGKDIPAELLRTPELIQYVNAHANEEIIIEGREK